VKSEATLRVSWDAAETVTTVTSAGVSLTRGNTTLAFNNAGWITVAPGGEVAVAFACEVSRERVAEVWVRGTAGWAAVDLGMGTARSGVYRTPTVNSDGGSLWLAVVEEPPRPGVPQILVVTLTPDSSAPGGYAEDRAWTLTALEDPAYPALAFDPVYGDPYLLYSGTDPDTGRAVLGLSVLLTVFVPTWFPMTVYDDATGVDTPTFGALSVGEDGIAIAWKNETSAGSTVRALYAPRGTRLFDASRVVGGDVAGIDAGDRAPANDPSVVLTESGDLYLAWQQAVAGKVGVSIWTTATGDPESWALGIPEEVSVGSATAFYRYVQLATAGNLVVGASELREVGDEAASTECDGAWFLGQAGATPGLDSDDAQGELDGLGSAEFAVFPTVVMEGSTIHVAWAEYGSADGDAALLTVKYQRGEVSYG